MSSQPSPETSAPQSDPNRADVDARNDFLRYGCDSEPIHHIGTVQPHGLTMVVALDSLQVVQVSEGWLRHFSPQLELGQILGSHLYQWFDADEAAFKGLLDTLRPLTRASQVDLNLLDVVTLGPQTFKVVRPVRMGETLLHRLDDYAVVEWAPTGSLHLADIGQLSQLSKLNEMLALLRRTENETEFFQAGVTALQGVSGFDRVMLYRFLPDASGEVLAEAVSDKTSVRFLGMRFPAGDIPPQARAMYLRSITHTLADVDATPDRLMPAVLPNGQLLDQTFCSLRQMSSAHMSYLHNMGIRATMSISLIKGGKLWGLLACHHLSPRVPPHHVRELMQAGCELIANLVTMRSDDIERQAYHEKRAFLGDLLHQFDLAVIKGNVGLVETVTMFNSEFLNLFGANHWGMRFSGRSYFSLPDPGVQASDVAPLGERVLDQIELFLKAQPIGEPLCINALQASGLELPAVLEAAGMMAVRFGLDGANFCVFFRPELSREVHWGGRPEKAQKLAADGTIFLEPRRSFDLWVELVRGHCKDWSALDQEFLGVLAATMTDHGQAMINYELNEKLRWRARHDFLTGLLNRSTLDAELAMLAQLPHVHFALFMIDMDHFKRINDSLGHRAGDEVIKEVGRRISSVTRGEDFASRFGGDEFVMVVHFEADQPEAPMMIARRLMNAMRVPILIDGTSLTMTLSVGIAVFPDHSKDPGDLMRRADIALYDAKGAGRARASCYSAEMEANALETLTLEGQLREAILNNGLCLFYQPKVDLRSGRVMGVEALVRWRHPERGLLGPDKFIPIAERSDLISDLGDWVVKEAVAQSARWRDAGLPDLSIAINISFSQFANANFLSILSQSMQEHGVEPEMLEIELTESVLMEDTALALRVLSQLKELRVRVSLDDFGTGYSSLSYLHQLPLSTLKIDRSFIAGLEHDPQAQLVTRAVLGLARGLQIRTVAEGVEDDYQRRWLMSHQCDMGQGYFFSRPVPPEDMTAVIQKIASKWR